MASANYDYTQQGAQENALDPVSFQDMYQFYMMLRKTNSKVITWSIKTPSD